MTLVVLELEPLIMSSINKNDQNNLPEIDRATSLAITRTRLAAERTLMSWIRTSFSMISFGFTIIKFFEYLKFFKHDTLAIQKSSSGQLGIFLILLGIISLVPAMIEYHKELSQLSVIDKGSRWSYAFLIAICVAILGIYALVNVLTNHF